MGPLPSPLAALEREYLVLRAEVDTGKVGVAEAAARMRATAVFDSEGFRWRVDPASPPHRAAFLVAGPDGVEISGNPAGFPPGAPRPPGTLPAAHITATARDGSAAPAPAPGGRVRWWVLPAAVVASVLVLFSGLRACAPEMEAPGPSVPAPPSSLAGLEPLPAG